MLIKLLNQENGGKVNNKRKNYKNNMVEADEKGKTCSPSRLWKDLKQQAITQVRTKA